MTTHLHLVALAGYIAAILTTLAFIPQLIRVWRLRSARDISLTMFLAYSFGVFLWFVYGIAIHSMPVVIANAVTFALSIAILVLKLRFDRQSSSPLDVHRSHKF